MIHTKALKFRYEGIDFEATVTYSDVDFTHEKAFYNVALHKPVEMKCGGEQKILRGMILMCFQNKKIPHYVYDETSDGLNESEINVYPKAIEKILYSYFNRDQIAYYRKQVKQFKEAVDAKYMPQLESIRAEKLALRKKLRAGEIDSKTYQKLYKPIRLRMEEVKYRVSRLKTSYESRYFQCCELKEKYRVFAASKTRNCDDRFSLCEFVPYLAKMKKEQ